jgi:phosphohistidine phosphatase
VLKYFNLAILQMKRVIMLRHADAMSIAGFSSDEYRELSETGLKQAESLYGVLQSNNISPQLIISSTAKRAVQTVTPLAQKFIEAGNANFSLSENFYLCGPAGFFDKLVLTHDTVESLLICAHNPGISEFLFPYYISPSSSTILSPASWAVVDFNADTWAGVPSAQGKVVLRSWAL